MNIAVLGCGPAGLMATHAAVRAGASVAIISHKRKSPLYGAQYLHVPIPYVTDRNARVDVEYQLRGTVDEYRRKVYGPMWDGTVSPEDLSDSHEAWDIRETYDRLWDMYHERINDVDIDPATVRMINMDEGFDLIINSIPRNLLCSEGHTFGGQSIIAAGDAPALGIDVGRLYKCTDATVVCNGEEHPSWYRLSRIFGHTTVEWPAIRPGGGELKVPLTTSSVVIKPTKHNCSCWPDIFHVGRYGEWKKGVLSHTAYFNTERRIEDGKATEAVRYDDPSVPTLW